MERNDRLLALASYAILDTPPEPGFDELAALARELCDAPIALVSLVDRDRQWFKARDGFAAEQTDLDCSVCRHVVEAGGPLVVPDLAADPRTSDNPLVTAGPRVRFYAGAPLTTAAGHVLGALCVLDTVPRPDGLSPAQRRQLEALARHAVTLIEMRLALAQRDGSEASAVAARNRWRDLFDGIGEALALASLVRDAQGRAVDLRFEELNRAWGTLTGVAPAHAVGRTAGEVFPGLEEAWIAEAAEVAETGVSARFTRELGPLGRWYEGHVQPADGDRVTFLFSEVTDRLSASRRDAALLAIGDALRECASTAEMTRAAATVVGEVLGASRAGYGQVDSATETVDIEADWRAGDLPSIAGRHRFADFGRIRDELARAEPLVIEDVDTDPRTAPDPGPMHALRIGALINMPVRERGRTVAVFIVQSETPRRWTSDELAFVRNVADRLESGIARARADERREVLNREIGHRLKNSLSMAQAIATQTLRRSADPDALAAYGARLQALGQAHDELVRTDLAGADLHDLIDRVLETAGVQNRCRIGGPRVAFGPNSALSASLLIHELTTNAVKHGALSAPGGRVDAAWTVEGDALTLRWTESGGPPAVEPATRGFGSTLLRLGLNGTGGGTVTFGASGLEAMFEASVAQVG